MNADSNTSRDGASDTVTITRGDVLWPEGRERPTGLRSSDTVFYGGAPLLADSWLYDGHEEYAVSADTTLGRVQAHNLANPDQTFNCVWHGGDEAPGDWDGSRVLVDDGACVRTIAQPCGDNWWPSSGWAKIIAYNARTAAPAQDKLTHDPETHMLVERRSLEQLEEDRKYYMRNPEINSALFYAKLWGIIRPEPSLADRLIGHTTTTAEGRQAIVDLVKGEGK